MPKPVTYPRTHRAHTFDPAHLYQHKETGMTMCGAHVGTEATYHPTGWYDLGPGESFTEGAYTFTCESGVHRTHAPAAQTRA
jgi:hypothetical protein